MKSELNNEQKLVLIGSQLHNSIDQSELALIMKNPLDWGKIIMYASKNKVLSLLYNNIVLSGYKDKLSKYYVNLFEDNLSCNILRNNEKLDELEKVQVAMYKRGIKFAAVKGGYLIDNLYGNRKIRITNDIDALVKKSDYKEIDKIMIELDYRCGRVEAETRKIIAPSRQEIMLYKTAKYNLLPYVKLGSETPSNTIIFDLSFALDTSLNTAVVDEILDFAVYNNNKLQLKPEHYLIHLCCHHYREAISAGSMLEGKDLTLMKFCDAREFIRNKVSKETLNTAIDFSKKYNLQKAVYFTIYLLREIYNDGYEDEVLSLLGIDDNSFMYKYGEHEYDSPRKRKNNFWTSIFSENNEDELLDEPKYYDLMNTSRM